jgi:hypothetical protein
MHYFHNEMAEAIASATRRRLPRTAWDAMRSGQRPPRPRRALRTRRVGRRPLPSHAPAERGTRAP